MSIDPHVTDSGGDLSGVAYRLSALDRKVALIAMKSGQLAAGAVQGAQIQADTITSSHIAAGAITASEISAGAVYAGAIQAGAVTASSIAANSITSNHIQANAVTATAIAANSITATHIAANAIYAGAIQAGVITATHITSGTITTTQIAADTITAGNIAANAITASELAANSITATHIQANAVTATALSANSVYAGAIQAGSVDASKITVSTLSSITSNMGSITAGTITGGTLQTAASGSRVVMSSAGLVGYALNGTTKVFEINAGSGVASFTGIANIDPASVIPGGTVTVGTLPGDRIVSASIATLQLAAGAVVANTIAAGAVTAGKLTIAALDGSGNLTANSVGNTQLTTDSVTTSKILASTIQGGDIAATTITGANIAATTITADKMSVTTLSAITADMGTITAGTVTGATIRTAATGTRVTLDSTGFKQFLGASGTPSIHFKTDGTDANVFTGLVSARGITLPVSLGGIGVPTSSIQWLNASGGIVADAITLDNTTTATLQLRARMLTPDSAGFVGASMFLARSSSALSGNYCAVTIPGSLVSESILVQKLLIDGDDKSDFVQHKSASRIKMQTGVINNVTMPVGLSGTVVSLPSAWATSHVSVFVSIVPQTHNTYTVQTPGLPHSLSELVFVATNSGASQLVNVYFVSYGY